MRRKKILKHTPKCTFHVERRAGSADREAHEQVGSEPENFVTVGYATWGYCFMGSPACGPPPTRRGTHGRSLQPREQLRSFPRHEFLLW
jgi:hypothetical protein